MGRSHQQRAYRRAQLAGQGTAPTTDGTRVLSPALHVSTVAGGGLLPSQP
ncbi:MAG: hypothetical protein QOE41_3135 [Mycobacterium sp.]|nr:hypothetical protein [Mycobacterium sp.]